MPNLGLLVDKDDKKPYQPGDFTPLRDSSRKNFHGPVWHVSYPPQCDPMQEMLDWESLGYRTSEFYYHPSNGTTMNVLGDISKELKENLERAGVQFRLLKERNKGNPILV